MAYRAAFLLDVVTITFNGLFYPLSFVLTFGRFGSLAGWSLGELAFIWGINDMAFGITRMFFDGFDHASFGQKVRQGTLDQLLLRPINITGQVMTEGFDLRRVGHITRSLCIFGYALYHVEVAWSVSKLFYFPLMLLGMVGFFAGIAIAAATVTFWTVEQGELIDMFTFGVKNLMNFPFHIYAGWMRMTFTYLIPAALLSYYPVLYLLAKPDPFGMPSAIYLLTPLLGMVILVLALQFWHFGIDHYQSTGT